jgi:hypothetical protein
MHRLEVRGEGAKEDEQRCWQRVDGGCIHVGKAAADGLPHLHANGGSHLAAGLHHSGDGGRQGAQLLGLLAVDGAQGRLARSELLQFLL